MGTRPPPSRTSILLLPSSRCPPVARLPNRGWSYDRYRTGNPILSSAVAPAACGGTQQMRPPSRRTAPPCTASSPSARRSTSTLYAYLLLAEHFSDTCVLAESAGGRIDGFISAYVLPDRPDVLFVWQVAVHARARGHRLAAPCSEHSCGARGWSMFVISKPRWGLTTRLRAAASPAWPRNWAPTSANSRSSTGNCSAARTMTTRCC